MLNKIFTYLFLGYVKIPAKKLQCRFYNNGKWVRVTEGDEKIINALVDSFKKTGFNYKYPVIINEMEAAMDKGLISVLDGHHRVAACRRYYGENYLVPCVKAAKHMNPLFLKTNKLVELLIIINLITLILILFK